MRNLRTLRSLQTFFDDARAQAHQPFDRDFHAVARFEIKLGRIRLTHGRALRRAHRDQVARLEADVASEILEHVGDLEDELVRVLAQAALAVHVASDPEVVDVPDLAQGGDERPERREVRCVLRCPEARARGDLTFLDFAQTDVVEDRDARDVIERVRLLHAMRALADHEDELRLVVERADAFRPSHLGVLAAHRVEYFYEAGRLIRHLGQHLVREQLLAMLARIFAYAEEFRWIHDRWQKLQSGGRLYQAGALGRGGEIAERGEYRRPGRERRLHGCGRHVPVELMRRRAYIDDAVVAQDSEPRSGEAGTGNCRKLHFFSPVFCLASAVCITAVHFFRSALMNLLYSAGVIGCGSAPRFATRSRTPSDLHISTDAGLSFRPLSPCVFAR